MIVRWPAGQRGWHGLVKEGHRKVAQIEQARFELFPRMKVLENPLRRLFRKPALPRTA
jgi:hypothetical protein